MKFVCCLLLAAGLLAADDTGSLERKAQSLLDSDPAQAAQLYRKILKDRPNWPPGWLYLGAALYATGDNAGAVEALNRGAKLAPKEGAAWGFMGLAENRLKHEDAALADIQKGESLGLGTNHGFESAVRQTAAYILIRHSHFDDAAKQLVPLANFADDSQGVVIAMGMCSLALAEDPQQLTPEQQQMVLLAGQGQWDSVRKKPAEAEAAFQKLLQQFPDGRAVHYAYALFLLENDQSAALDQLHIATKANPDLWPAWMLSATLETKSGDPAAALEAVEKVRRLGPPDVKWLCDTESGRADLALGHNDQAIAELKKALAEGPEYPQLHHLLAQAYRHEGKTSDAQKEDAEFERLTAKSDPEAIVR